MHHPTIDKGISPKADKGFNSGIKTSNRLKVILLNKTQSL